MMRISSALCAGFSLVAAFALAAATPAAAAMPAGFHATDGPSGGRIVEGAVAGASSPDDLLRRGLKTVHGLAGNAPDVLSAARSTDDTLTVALFRVTHAGTPIGGLILATYGKHGGSRVAIVYDRADRFGSTAKSLVAHVTAMKLPSAGGTASGAQPQLHAVAAPDGSVHAALPDGWKTPIFAQGQFGAIGPDGEEVDQEVSANVVDPRSGVLQQWVSLQQQIHQPINPLQTPYGIPLTYVADPAHAFAAFVTALARYQHRADPGVTIASATPVQQQGMFRTSHVTGTQTVKGARTKFDGIVGIQVPRQTGTWMISIKMVSAPVARFDAALPTLTAIYNSYNVDQNVRNGQVQQTMAEDRAGAARGAALMAQTQAQNTATFNASMSHARSVQDGIDRSTAGFTHYLSDTTVLESSSGARGSVNDSFAQSVVDNDPQNFRVVPVSEYRKGIDY